MEWTEEQKNVIKSIDKNTLVSASAGSGKTAVMLERLVRIVVGNKEEGRKGVPLRRIVTVTFNESVANELKSKISGELVKLINTGVADNDYLRAQIEDIPLADISTLHAFCSNLIKTNFEQIDIDPSFSIADDSERQVLFNKAIAEVMKKYKTDYDYKIDILMGYCRNEGAFYELIKKVYGFLEAQPDRQKYLDETALQNYKGEFFKTALAVRFTDSVKERALQLLIEGNKKRDEYEFANADKYVNHLDLNLERFKRLSDAKDFRELCAAAMTLYEEISDRPFERSKKDAVLSAISEDYKAFAEKYNELYAYVKGIIKKPYDASQSEIENDGVYMAKLIEVVREVAEEYAKMKKKENKLDFSDLEYYAVKLLSDDKTAKELGEKYDYICVDEYQDINAVQEYILTRLSNGKNLFMVGDVKQSIYQFRMTDPEIFLNKYRYYKVSKDAGSPHSLNKNYRSCGEILEFVNSVFDVIMTEKCGGINYKSESRLVQGNEKFTEQKECPVKIVTFAKNKTELNIPVGDDGVYSVKDSLSEQTASEYEEGIYIANEILKLVQYGTIQDVKDKNKKEAEVRKIRFSDIAVLSATRSENVEKILNVIKSAGIPIDANSLLKEKSNPSIALAADLMRVLDNHRNDIPLTAVLTSVFGGLTNDSLARIKAEYGNEKFFHNAVIRYSREQKDAIAKKLKEFFAMLEKYRFAGGFMSVSELLRRILIDFDYSTYLHTFDYGKAEYTGLEQFIGNLEGMSYNSSVSKFVDAMNKVEDFGNVAGDAGIQGNCVKTSTIHAAKGLEYPIVFVVDCAKEANLRDANSSLFICDKRYGMTMKTLDEEERSYDDSLPMLLMKDVKTKDIVEEYMRLFYVAATRAQNKLYFTATALNEFGKKTTSKKSMWAWLNNIACNDEEFKKKYAPQNDEQEEEELETVAPVYTFRQPDGKTAEECAAYFDKPYAFASATVTPVKYTVTALNNMSFENKKDKKDAKETQNFKNLLEDFVEETRENGEYDADLTLYADEGIAYHRVMECIDFDCYTVGDVQKRIDEMVEDRLLTAQQRAFVNPRLILDCLENPVVSLARKYPHYREKQFMLNLPADEITDTDVKDTVLLQGTVDLFIAGREKDGQNVLVDFKFSKKDEEQIKRRYSKQLELYAMAIEECMNTKVDKKVIFVLGQKKIIEM